MAPSESGRHGWLTWTGDLFEACFRYPYVYNIYTHMHVYVCICLYIYIHICICVILQDVDLQPRVERGPCDPTPQCPTQSLQILCNASKTGWAKLPVACKKGYIKHEQSCCELSGNQSNNLNSCSPHIHSSSKGPIAVFKEWLLREGPAVRPAFWCFMHVWRPKLGEALRSTIGRDGLCEKPTDVLTFARIGVELWLWSALFIYVTFSLP